MSIKQNDRHVNNGQVNYPEWLDMPDLPFSGKIKGIAGSPSTYGEAYQAIEAYNPVNFEDWQLEDIFGTTNRAYIAEYHSNNRLFYFQLAYRGSRVEAISNEFRKSLAQVTDDSTRQLLISTWDEETQGYRVPELVEYREHKTQAENQRREAELREERLKRLRVAEEQRLAQQNVIESFRAQEAERLRRARLVQTVGKEIVPDLVEKIADLNWELQNADDDGKHHLAARLAGQIEQLQAELDYRVNRETERVERRNAGIPVSGFASLKGLARRKKLPLEGVSLRLFPGTLAMLWADKGQGKTTVSFLTALELAISGKRVFMLVTEQERDDVPYDAYLAAYPDHEDMITRNLILADKQDWRESDISDGNEFDLANPATTYALQALIEDESLDLVIIDTMSRAFSGSDMSNENTAKSITGALLDVISATGATILFTHHSTKSNGDYSGSWEWQAKSATVMNLYRNAGKTLVVDQNQRFIQDGQKTFYEMRDSLLLPVTLDVPEKTALDRETAILNYLAGHSKPVGATAIFNALKESLGLTDKKQVDRVLQSLKGTKVKNSGRKGWELI